MSCGVLGAVGASWLFASAASAQSAVESPAQELPPPPVYGQPVPQPQPVQPNQPNQPTQPGQPVYQPPPAYGAQPGMVPYDSSYAMRPMSDPYARTVTRFRPQLGIGIHATGLIAGSDLLVYGQGGINFDVLFRVHPRLTLEFSIGYQHTDSADDWYGYYYRNDMPLLLGMRIYTGRLSWRVQPYIVAAIGGDRAYVETPDAAQYSWFGEAQFGGGIEFRPLRSFAVNLDLRGFGRFRSATSDDIYLSDPYGLSQPLLGNHGGVQANAGVSLYF